jgi:hypothetical protein
MLAYIQKSGGHLRIFLFIFATLAAGYFGIEVLTKHHAKPDQEKYNLSSADANPIPTEIALELWKVSALKFCTNFTADDVKITKHTAEQCKKRVESTHSECGDTIKPEYPTKISNKSDVRHLGKDYFACTLPLPDLSSQ